MATDRIWRLVHHNFVYAARLGSVGIAVSDDDPPGVYLASTLGGAPAAVEDTATIRAESY